eukprot:NODE_392_length_8143_cov_0.403282.p3 type:complete len:329 gc:universal NODE_392_length_8143_cov_0.403282:4512-3526(-)
MLMIHRMGSFKLILKMNMSTINFCNNLIVCQFAPCMILITGASGLLGAAVYRQFKQHFLVTGTCHSQSHPELTKIDLTNEDEINQLFLTHQFNCVIHLVAERQPDVFKHDPSKAIATTESTTQYLLKHCKSLNIPFIFISTDYVFDGKKGSPYLPSDATNPLNDYGKSKVVAENLVKSYENGIIIRIPVLYGHLYKEYDGAIDSLLKYVHQNESAELDNVCKRFPANVMDIANVFVDFYKKLLTKKPHASIYHFCGPQCLTKYQMCLIFGKILSKPVDYLKPFNQVTGEATRPIDVELDTSDLSEYVGYDIRTKQVNFEVFWRQRLLK